LVYLDKATLTAKALSKKKITPYVDISRLEGKVMATSLVIGGVKRERKHSL
jgi:hypothetical protein